MAKNKKINEKNQDEPKEEIKINDDVNYSEKIYNIIEKEIDDEYNQFKSFRNKAYAFITIIISIISILLSTFDYDKIYDSFDDSINNATTVFIIITAVGIITLGVSFIFLFLSTKDRNIDILCPKLLIEDINEKEITKENDFYKYLIEESRLEAHESLSNNSAIKRKNYRIGIILGLIAIIVLLVCYVALRILVNR